MNIDKSGAHLLAPTVTGIITRFNDDATRAEAALSAVVVLQALQAMGVFDPPRGAAGIKGDVGLVGGFVQPARGQRPIASSEVARRLEEELRKPGPEQIIS